jgi:CubicO group peptidase (beta-lactamase class C family)
MAMNAVGARQNACQPVRARKPPVSRLLRTGLLLGIILLMPVLVRAQATSTPSDVDWAAVDGYVESEMARGSIPGLALAVVHEDKVVYLKGYGEADASGRAVTPQTPFIVGSVGKTFTALAIEQLHNAGKIDLDAPAQRYLPWFRVADPVASAQISVRHLVEHTSGIPTSAGNKAYQTDNRYTTEELVRMAADVELAQPVGATFQYSNINYLVLGLIVEAVSGQPYADYVAQNILTPLGMQNSFLSEEAAQAAGLATGHRPLYGISMPSQAPFPTGMLPAGYTITSAEDLGTYMIAYLNHGRVDDLSITDPSGAAPPLPANSYYDVEWVLHSGTGEDIGSAQSGASTNYNAVIYLLPGKRWAVAVLMNTRAMIGDFVDVPIASSIGAGIGQQLAGWRTTLQPARWRVTQAYVVVDLILLLLLVFGASRLWRLRRWRRASALNVRPATLVSLLFDLGLGLSILVGIPLATGAAWSYHMITMPDVVSVLVGVGILLLLAALSQGILLVSRSRRRLRPHLEQPGRRLSPTPGG